MSLMDQAARALAASQRGHDDWESLDMARRHQFRRDVCAILKAVRDPDDRMAEAGTAIIRNVGLAESETAYLNDAANTWRLMIDALLDEK